MAFIKVRNLKKNSAGQCRSGTATILDVSYAAGVAGHSRQIVRERLGEFHEAASIGCFMENSGRIRVETADKQARLAYDTLGLKVPGSVRPADSSQSVFGSANDV